MELNSEYLYSKGKGKGNTTAFEIFAPYLYA